MLTRVVTRATELALILVGLGFIFVSVDDDELVYLGIWDLLALCYVGVGVIALRRSRLRPPRSTPEPARRDRFRFNFAFAIVSSLIGFTVAIDIATSDNPGVPLLRGHHRHRLLGVRRPGDDGPDALARHGAFRGELLLQRRRRCLRAQPDRRSIGRHLLRRGPKPRSTGVAALRDD
jgi:hypothetical protein